MVNFLAFVGFFPSQCSTLVLISEQNIDLSCFRLYSLNWVSVSDAFFTSVAVTAAASISNVHCLCVAEECH